MTLALYGKSRRRKGLLILLALFAILAATVSGAALRPGEGARAASTTIDPASASCADDGNTSDSGGDCTASPPTVLNRLLTAGDSSAVHIETDEYGNGAGDVDGTGDDDLTVRFNIPNISGTLNSATFRVWSSQSPAGEGISLRLGSNSSGASETRYGSTAVGAPSLYTANVLTDVQSYLGTEMPLNISVDCTGTNVADCGALVDKVELVIDYTPSGPDLQVNKVAKVGGNTVTSVTLPSAAFDWVITMSNQGTTTASFASGAAILTDELPTTGATYTVTQSNSNVLCSITSSVLTCSANGGAKAIGAGSNMVVTVNVTPTAAGTLSNPRSGGTCAIDPNGAISETNEANNGCTTSSVTVNSGPPVLVQAFTDAQGANDEPGQKDLTRMSIDTANAPTSIAVTWNWDELGTNGANTLDGCALFDTDGDGNANYSLCQTTTGNPGTAQSTTLYSCNDANADRCNGNNIVSPFTSTCTVGAGTDPFPTGDSYPNDRQASCTVNLADVGASSANLIDVCSYPSQQPNSDPSDCVLAATGGVSRTIRVMKVTGTALHPAAAFSGTISPGGDTSFSVSLTANDAVSPADDNIVSDQAQTVTETTLPADWTNVGYYVQAASGNTLYTCTGNETYTAAASAAVPADTSDYTVCIKNTYAAPTRTLRVMKVTGSATHPAETFVGTISPGAKTSFSVSLGPDTAVSAADSGTVSSAIQTVTETPVPGAWVQAGYYVHEDTSGPYTCTGAETYANAGGSATVPASSSNYTVCVKNTYSPATIVVHKEEAGAKTYTADTWQFGLSGGPTTASNVQISDAGQSSFAGLAAGTYAVTELNSGAVTSCTGAGAGAYIATHGTATNPSTPGQAETGITVTAGQTVHVYFKNDGCGGALSIAKSSSPETIVAAGGSATWTITVTVANNPTTAANAITDSLPGGFTVAAPGISDGASGGGDDAKMSCSPTTVGTTTFTCTLAAGAPAGTYSITVPVTAPANFPPANCTTYTNTAQITGGAQASDTLAVTGCVNPSLALSKSNSLNGPLGSGGTFNWIVKATITGGPTVAPATISDTLPAGFSFNGVIAFTGSQDGSKLSCLAPVGQTVSCTLASGAADGDYFIIIPVQAPTVSSATQCGNYTNSATASFPADMGNVTGSPASNQVSLVCPVLTIAKSANPAGPVNLGDPIGFDLTITNTSTVPATGVSVSDTLPSVAGVVWSTATAGCSITSGGTTLSCAGLTVAANNGTFVVHVSGSTSGVSTRAACGPITNDNATATVIGVTSTSGSASVTVNCPSITLAKVANPAGPVNAGANIGWTFTVTNTTSVVASNVSVSDTLPMATGVTWSSTANTTSGTGSCSVTGGVLTCGGLTVPASGSVTVTVTGTTTASGENRTCGTITNSGATGTLLGTVSNQLADASVTVNCPDPSVAKGGNGPVTAGDNLVFTVTVTAGGTGTQSVVLTDVMPGTGLSWTLGGVNAGDCTPAGPLNSGSQYSCTFNNLNPGDSRVVTFTAASTPAMCSAGALQNTATIAAAAGSVDTNSSNNTANASITVNCPNVTLTKVADAPTANAGDQIGFTITATNSGTGTARGFVLTDALPGNVSWGISPANANCVINAGVLRCPPSNSMDLAGSGGTLSVHIVGTTTAASCGTVSNTASAVVANQVSAIPNASAQVTVNCPDLTVTKTADNGTINAGDTAAFTIIVTNTGTGTAKSVTLSDTLPAGITWTEDSADCSIASGVMSCTFGDIAAGDTRTVHVTGLTAKENCSVLSNTATVSATNEANTGNNSSTASIGVNCAEISVVKTADQTQVSATDTVGFTITATNNGAGAAYGVTVTDALPAGGGLNWTESPDNADCTISSGTLTCTFGTLAPGASKSVHISSPTTVATCGTLNNTALVGTTNDGNGQSAAAIVVNCPNVSITKTRAPGQADPVNAGDTIAFQIEVTVSGTGTAYNVTASDTLPSNTSQWVVTNDASAPTACGILSAVLSCNFGNVTAPQTFTITLSGKAIGATGGVTCGTLSNTATAGAGNEANTSDNTSTATIGVNCPTVAVAKTAANSPISAGAVAEFVITASNTGLGTATGVQVTDALPAGLSWTVNPAVTGCGIVSGVLTCNFASMASGASVEIHVTATTTPASCGVLTNYAQISAANDAAGEPAQSNLAMITVNCPDVKLVKTASNSPISAGDNASFTLTVTNIGQGTASGVTVSDQLPAGPAWTDDSADCSINGSGLLTCSVATLPAGGMFAVTVTGATTAAQCGVLANEATVAATNEPESSFGNNIGQASITVNCPDLTLVKTASNSPISAGDNASFTLTVTNTGLGTAAGVSITDQLPASGIGWTDDSASCSIDGSGLLTCAIATLAPAGTFSVTVTGATTAAQCGTLVNLASASATNEPGSNTGNNTGQASITVNCPDIKVEKTPDGGGISAGETATFTIVVSNIGAGTAHNVTLSDTLPFGLTWVEDSAACSISSGVLSCAWEQIAAGGSQTVTVSAVTTPAQCQQLLNTASATAANESDSTGANNQDDASVTVACPDVDVVKSASNSPINPGETAAFTITVHNAGPGDAFGVALNDALPAGLAWSADNTTDCEIVAGVLTCEWKTIAAGASQVVTVSATTSTAQCGVLDNTASITVSNEAEGMADDNTSNASIVVACGSIQVIKIDGVSVNDPERPAQWNFTITGPNGFNESRSIALGGGSVTVSNVPLGSGYAVSEVQAKFGACPQPNETGTYRTTANNGPQNLTAAGQTISFSFNNQECGIVLSTGTLVINKVADTNGNHVQDAGEAGLTGWPVTVTGPEFPSGAPFFTGANGQLVLPGIKTGTYTIAEGSQAGYQAVGVVTDDNTPVFNASTSTSITLEFSDTDVVTFFNRPLGSIAVNKTTQVVLNGAIEPQPQDRDGWRITVSSAACGTSVTRETDSSGNALFTNLPACGDYVVSEDLSAPGAPNYTPAGAASVNNVSPGTPATRVNFVNQRVVTVCSDCTTPPTPTPTATTPPNTPTNTPTPTVRPPTVTPSPVSTQAGERTPGTTPTPIAPSTGAGWSGGAVGGVNLLVVIAGLFAATGALTFLGLSRKR